MQVRTPRDFGSAVKERRNALGWTQQDLAARAGVTRQWVIALEKGKPTAELALTLRALAALGLAANLVEAAPQHGPIDLDELLGGHGA